tara:strand:- start:551 stop:1348 length:798 start_codon:yes stop_codon:yes gene_type:complete
MKNRKTFEEEMYSQTELPGDLISRTDINFISHRYFKALTLAQNKDVLEIGAGSVIGKREMAAASKTYTAIDITKENIDSCLPLGNEIGIDFIHGDAHNTSFENGSFDLIIALAMIYYLDIERFLNEAKRILRPNGKLFFCTSNKNVHGFVPSPYITNYYSVPELDSVLNAHGFEAKFQGSFNQDDSIVQRFFIFSKNLVKNILLILGFDNVWRKIRDGLRGEKIRIPVALADFPEQDTQTLDLDRTLADRTHKIIYCESILKESQ